MNVQKIDSKITDRLEQIYDSNKLINRYNLIKNLKNKNNKEVPGMYNQLTKEIFINSRFKNNENAKKLIFVHEFMHYLFGCKGEKLRHTLVNLTHNKNDILVLLLEEHIIRYSTYLFFLNNLDLLSINNKEELVFQLRNIDALNDRKEIQDKPYFYQINHYKEEWYNPKVTDLILIIVGLDKDINLIKEINKKQERDNVINHIHQIKKISSNVYKIVDYLFDNLYTSEK